jgi:peptide/nickel transport system permease protein/oligopeptide transport system permease protein
MASAGGILAVSAQPAALAPGGWQRLKANRLAMASLAFLTFMAVVCCVAPIFFSQERRDPSENNFARPMQSADVAAAAASPAAATAGAEDSAAAAPKRKLTYWWGADVNGKDLLLRTLEGGRVTLIIGFTGAILSLVIGTFVGLVSGYLGGKIDAFLMRGVDVLYAIPRLLFMLVVIGALKGPFGKWLGSLRAWAEERHWPLLKNLADDMIPLRAIVLIILCLSLIEWLTMARIVRGQVLVLKEQQFVAAARTLGRGKWAIMRRHLLPNLWPVILTYLTLTVPIVIMDESFLSFLGLGVDEPATSWGALLKEGAQAVNPIESRWWLLVFPAATMSLTLLALNFLGDGLRDALDVR